MQKEQSQPKVSDKLSDAELKTDVLLITVTTVEAQAVLSIFAKESGKLFQRRFIGDKTYFDLGMFHDARVVMVQSEMGTLGPGGALLVVDEGIRQLSPSAVIMVGIAFGVDEEKQKIGDILVSQQLLGYEMQRVGTDEGGMGKIMLRGDRPRASSRLVDRFRSGMLDWSGAKVECGLLLSGEKLIDNRLFRDQLLKFAPDALGGEMEGTGLYSAAQLRKVDWIIVKAVCDWADGDKGRNKETSQRVAAENATHFVIHVLKQGGFAWAISSGVQTSLSRRPAAPLPERGTLLHTYNAHASWVLAVDWEPGGNRVVSAGADGTVRVWEAETGKGHVNYHGHTRLLNKVNHQALIYTAAWSPEGLRIASAGSGSNVSLWNAATGQTLTLYREHSGLLPCVYAVAWSPSGKQLASVCSSAGFDKTIHIWDANTGQTLARYDAHYGLLPNFSVVALVWSPDGTHLAAACGDRTIRLWETETGRLISLYRVHAEWSSHLAWSPDSRHLATAYSDHTAQVWDTETGTNMVTYHGHTNNVRYVAWSPDGASLATASNDRTVHVWEAMTGRHIYTYRGHSDWVTSVAWSSDGIYIASASNDKTVQVWYGRGNT